MAVKIKEGGCALGVYTLLVLLSQLNTEKFLSSSAGLKYDSVSLGNILSPSHGHTTEIRTNRWNQTQPKNVCKPQSCNSCKISKKAHQCPDTSYVFSTQIPSLCAFRLFLG